MRREENQLDVTECFIALMISSTRFGYFYAHHQELETVCVCVCVCYYRLWCAVFPLGHLDAGFDYNTELISLSDNTMLLYIAVLANTSS